MALVLALGAPPQFIVADVKKARLVEDVDEFAHQIAQEFAGLWVSGAQHVACAVFSQVWVFSGDPLGMAWL